MHLAIVIESSYRENVQLAELPGAHASAELVSARLTQAGFQVERVPASRELASYLDDRLLGAAAPFESLLVYYVGYAALNPERGPALLLDGPRLRAFPLSRLGRSIMSASYSGALIVDAFAVPEPGQTAQEIADAMADVVPREGRVSTLVAARDQRDAGTWMPSRLSDLFVIGIDWLEATGADPKTITLQTLLRVIREERISFSLVGATTEYLAEEDFALLPARLAARPSGPVRSLARETAPRSEPVQSWAPRADERPPPDAPLPSFDDPDSMIAAFDDQAPVFGNELPRFDDEASSFDNEASSFDDEEGTLERSSVLPSPAARRESAANIERPRRGAEELAELIASCDHAEQHEEAVAAREELAAELTSDPARRAYILEEAARIAGGRLGDSARAVRLAREALDVDPTSLGALDVVTGELGNGEAWLELATVYEGVLKRLADGPIAARIAAHLGAIRRTRLGDFDGALKAFERALACDPADPTVLRKVAEVREERGETEWAIRFRRAEAKSAPSEPVAYRAAVHLFSEAGELDAAWNAAAALVALGAADDTSRALHEAHRDGGLLQVQRGLSFADWTSGLLDPDRDREISNLFAFVEDAAIKVRLDQLARARALPDLPDSARHDPEKSTAMLARSLLWTSKLLGADAPLLYVVDGAPGQMVPAPAPTRTSLVSRTLASGLALGELSFLWARHLTFQHAEHHVLTFYSTPKALTDLLFAVKAVGSPDPRSIDFPDAEAKALARALGNALTDSAQRELASRVRGLSTDTLADRAFAWARSVELVAGRVGLLACGDVSIAANLVTRFPLPGLLSPSAQREDLLAYSVSAEYGELRGRLGAQIRPHERRAG
jgi:tetratricopeptide (TPR) repeat protein